MTDEEKVKQVYPKAICHFERTFNGKCEEYTVYDPVTVTPVGPTSFTEANAWRWAAERLERGK